MNSLETDELWRFLNAGPANFAVLAEHTAAEIMKQELDQLAMSCRVISQFPPQVLMLKGNRDVAKLSPFAGAVANRFIDKEATKAFGPFCKAVKLAVDGHRGFRAQLATRRKWAQERVETIMSAFGDQTEAIDQLKGQIKKEDLRKIKLNEPGLSSEFRLFLIEATTSLAFSLNQGRPGFKRMTSGRHRLNDFTWRYALCHLLYLIDLLADGATRRSISKATNDHFDCVYATFGTYFNGMMSHDRLALRTQAIARAVLRGLGAVMPPDYIESGYDLKLLDNSAVETRS